MLAATAAVALTAGAALVVPVHLTGPVDTARLALAAVDKAAQPTGARQATDAAPGRTSATTPATAGQETATPTSSSASATPNGAVPAATTAGPSRAIDRRGDHRRQQPAQGTPPNPACTLIVPADPTTARG